MPKSIPQRRSAIVFQGGGALGAYEVGYYQALYEKHVKSKKNENPFDIVVGTSIGAINGALLVSYFQKNHTWDGSVEYLKEFWNHISSNPKFADVVTKIWNTCRKFFPDAPSEEMSRRFFSTQEFLYLGVPNIFTQPTHRFDSQFYALAQPWLQANNQALKESLEKFIDFPISTDFEKNEPQLLLVATDVQEAVAVVFDSYKNADGKRKTIYGQKKSKDGKATGGFLMEYDGIGVDHILASSSVPIIYDYTKLNAKEINGTEFSNGKEVTRYFWDGGMLHNTPLLHLIIHHARFWGDLIGIEKMRESIFTGNEEESTIPELDTYVVDMWTKKSEIIPKNINDMMSRCAEIMLADKTQFEEHLMTTINEKTVLFKELIALAKQKGATKEELEKVLLKPIKSQFRPGVKRLNIDHIRGKFAMNLLRIQRSKDPDNVAFQMLDFSPKTIETFFNEGYVDSKQTLEKGFTDEESFLF